MVLAYPRDMDDLDADGPVVSDGFVVRWRGDKGTGVVRPDNGDRDGGRVVLLGDDDG
jgi:hypothetical protein